MIVFIFVYILIGILVGINHLYEDISEIESFLDFLGIVFCFIFMIIGWPMFIIFFDNNE